MQKYFSPSPGYFLVVMGEDIQECVMGRWVMSNSLRLHGLQPASLLCPQHSPGKNTGVDCHSLLQGIFLVQRLNLGLLHGRQILYHPSYQASHSVQFTSVQSLSHVRHLATPWTAACQASLSITNSQRLFKLMSIKSVMPIQPSHPLLSPSPPTFNHSQHQGLFQ